MKRMTIIAVVLVLGLAAGARAIIVPSYGGAGKTCHRGIEHLIARSDGARISIPTPLSGSDVYYRRGNDRFRLRVRGDEGALINHGPHRPRLTVRCGA